MKWKYVNRQRKLALAIKTGKKSGENNSENVRKFFLYFFAPVERHLTYQVMPLVGSQGGRDETDASDFAAAQGEIKLVDTLYGGSRVCGVIRITTTNLSGILFG